VVNTRPVANAGPDQSVVVGSLVTLDGSGSQDAEGDPLTYAWSITTRPAGSAAPANLGSATHFQADVAGKYVVSLTADDGSLTSSPDEVTVTAFVKAQVPDTYQGISYTASPGEDADYMIGWATYTTGPTGTISDSLTGLNWQVEDDGIARTWEDANAFCAGFYIPGAGPGWRLPTPYELSTMAFYGMSTALPAGLFLGGRPAAYWTGVDGHAATDAWIVDFDSGGLTTMSKNSPAYTRCVRGGPSGFVFSDSGGGTVTDLARGLIWQQADDGATKTWEQALAECEGLTLAGASDWRLPTVKDLISIEDFSKYPVANMAAFPTTKDAYWSSTTVQRAPATAWQVSYLGGGVGLPGLDKATAAAYVRCVRGP
jgi:hypothetical protein